MRKLNLRISIGIAVASGLLLGSIGSQAHTFKNTDLNGGHWDDGGYYHCHLAGCVQTAHRHQFRSRALNSQDGLTVFLVEQNAYHALKLAHRGYVMINGLITLSGTGAELLERPEVRAAYLEGGRQEAAT